MPSHRQISKDWDCARSYVDRCVKRGCPTDTFENARLWRQAHASSRPPTNKKGLAKATEEETDEDSPEERERRRIQWLERPEGWKATSGTLEEALGNAIRACEEAWRLLQEAMIEGKSNKISVWLALHNRAVEGRVKVERLIREELERQKVLIPMSEAQTSTRRVVEIVVSRLSSMPQNLAHACNPSSPDHAFEILQRECTSIMADTQKAIA